MVDPGGSDFTDEDRREFRDMGREEYLIRLIECGWSDYPNPFGDGTTFITHAPDGNHERRTAEFPNGGPGCREGRLVWCARTRRDERADQADDSYLISHLPD
ncbi:MAG TPA: hypothetical protein VM677_35405 [Actinokineospora sp.]|jgi:hypothetical protein|nr:hypothetical protein [Actinokineospora sp.]